MMASSGNRTITIRIISEDQKAAPSPVPSDNQSENDAPSPNASNSSSKEKSKSLFAQMHLASKAKDFVFQEAEYYTGKYLSVTEDYRMQTTLQNVKNTIQFGFSVYASAKAGAALGAAAGPAGSVAGAVIGTTMAVAQKVQSGISAYSDAAQAIVNNAYGNYFYGERAGFASGGYGTEN